MSKKMNWALMMVFGISIFMTVNGQEQVLKKKFGLIDLDASQWISCHDEESSYISVYIRMLNQSTALMISPVDKNRSYLINFPNAKLWKYGMPKGAIKSKKRSEVHWVFVTKKGLGIYTIDFEENKTDFNEIDLGLNLNSKQQQYIISYYDKGVFRLLYKDSYDKTISVVTMDSLLKPKTQVFNISSNPILFQSNIIQWSLQTGDKEENSLINSTSLSKVYPREEEVILSYETGARTQVLKLNLKENKVIERSFIYNQKAKKFTFTSFVLGNHVYQAFASKESFEIQIWDIKTQKKVKKMEFLKSDEVFLTAKNMTTEIPRGHEKHDSYAQENMDNELLFKWYRSNNTFGLILNRRADSLIDIRAGFLYGDNGSYPPFVIDHSIPGLLGVAMGSSIVAEINLARSTAKGKLQQIPAANGRYSKLKYTTTAFDLVVDPTNSFDNVKSDRKRQRTIYDRMIEHQHKINVRKEGVYGFYDEEGAYYFCYFNKKTQEYIIDKI